MTLATDCGVPAWWRWVVLAATFYMNFIINGYAYTYGMLKIPLGAEYPDASPMLLSSIGGAISGLYMGMGPIAIALAEAFGTRYTTIGASMFATLCLVVAWLNGTFFNGGVYLDLFTLGIGQGIALGILYGPSIAILPTYFPLEQIAFASGAANAGSSVGIIVYALMANPLFNAFGWRGTMLVYAMISLQGVLAGFAFVSLEKFLPCVRRKAPGAVTIREDDAEDATTEKAILTERRKIPEKLRKESFTDVMRRFLNPALFGQWTFIMALLAGVLSIFGYYIPTLLIPGQARNPKYNVHPRVAENLVVIFGVMNLTGRLVLGRLGDFGHKYVVCSSIVIFTGSMIVCALTLFTIPHLLHLGNVVFIAFMVIYAFGCAPIITFRNVYLINLFGKANASASYGWLLFGQISQVGGYILCGFLEANYGPVISYGCAAVTYVLGAIVCLMPAKQFFAERRRQIADLQKANAQK